MGAQHLPPTQDEKKEEAEEEEDATLVIDDTKDDNEDDAEAAETWAEIRRVLSRRQPIHSTEDDPLDPIEWTFRKLIPIPETYYWEYTPPSSVTTTTTSTAQEGETQDAWHARLPWHLKAWHRTIGAADRAMQWTDRWIAQPVAGATGLTAPRMSYVTDHMTAEEWAAARQRLRQQKQQRRVIRAGRRPNDGDDAEDDSDDNEMR